MSDTIDRIASSRAVVRSGIFNLAGFVASAVYMIILVPMALHALGSEEYGLWTAVVALTGYIGLADLGLSTSFVTFIARFLTERDMERAGRVIHLGLVFYLLVTVLMLALAIAASGAFFGALGIPAGLLPVAHTSLLLAAAVFGITSVAGVYGTILGAIQRVDLVNILTIVSSAVKLAVMWVVLENGGGIPGLLLVEAGVTLLHVPVLLVIIRREIPGFPLFRWSYDHALMKQLFRYGIQLQVSRLADVVQAQWDKLVLTRALGLPAAAAYDIGARPAGRIRSLPITLIAALVPAISSLQAQDREERIASALMRGTRYLALIAAPLFGGAAVFAGSLLDVWLGPGYTTAAWTLRLLSIGFFVNVVVGALSLVSQGRAEPEYQMRTTLVQVALNLVLSVVLVSAFGFYGAVAGTVTATIVGGILFFHVYGRRLMPAPLRTLVQLTWRPVLAVIPSGILGLAAAEAVLLLPLPAGRPAAGAALAAGTAVFAVLYVLSVRWSGALTADDAGFFRNALPERIQRLPGFRHTLPRS